MTGGSVSRERGGQEGLRLDQITVPELGIVPEGHLRRVGGGTDKGFRMDIMIRPEGQTRALDLKISITLCFHSLITSNLFINIDFSLRFPLFPS